MKETVRHKRNIVLWIGLSLVVVVVLFIIWSGLGKKVFDWAVEEEKKPVQQERITGFNKLREKVMVRKNITYSKRFGDRKLDVYMPKAPADTLKPTIFWAHGGAFIAGDKKSVADYSTMLASQGYVVVNINYSLAPDYQYPTPVLQIGDAYSYIASNANRYRVDLEHVAFGGDSAGGQIMGQFVNVQVDEDYASRVDLDPVIKDSHSIKAVVFFSALLDINQYDENGNKYMNEVFGQSAQAYFNLEEWKGTEIVNKANIVGNVGKDYPPTYMTDGNTASFQSQAEALRDQLRQNEVPVSATFFAREQAELRHQYQFRFSLEEAVENYEALTTFLEQYLCQCE